MTPPCSPYISTADAAALWGVKPSTFRAYSRRGQAPPSVLRGFYDRSAVESWPRPGSGWRKGQKQSGETP